MSCMGRAFINLMQNIISFNNVIFDESERTCTPRRAVFPRTYDQSFATVLYGSYEHVLKSILNPSFPVAESKGFVSIADKNGSS